MTRDAVFRIASDDDLSSLAVLRWRLKEGDDAPAEGEAFGQFAAAFMFFERRQRAAGEIVHWIADVDGKPVAAMSVVVVRKMLSPGSGEGRWGYLTNCYVAPEQRNAAIGRGLIDMIQSWAKENALEFLVVWPSERGFPFYERSGFRRPNDLLVWTAAP